MRFGTGRIIILGIIVAAATAATLFRSEVSSLFRTTASNHYFIGVDPTGGRENQLPLDSAFIINTVIPELSPGDAIDVWLIHGYSESRPMNVLSYSMPEEKGPMEAPWKRAQREVDSLFQANWRIALRQVIGQPPSGATDVFGHLRRVSTRKTRATRNIVTLLSDMQVVADQLDFEKTIPDSNTTAYCERAGLIPDLSGCEINVLGCTATHAISNAHYRLLTEWWTGEYFPETGGTLARFTSDYGGFLPK